MSDTELEQIIQQKDKEIAELKSLLNFVGLFAGGKNAIELVEAKSLLQMCLDKSIDFSLDGIYSDEINKIKEFLKSKK